MAPAPFKVRTEQRGNVSVVVVEGELDMSTAPQLERALEDPLGNPGSAVLIDLSACEFVDSTGIALIVRSWQRADGNGGLALCGVANQVERVLDITGLESTIPSYPSREDAIARLRG